MTWAALLTLLLAFAPAPVSAGVAPVAGADAVRAELQRLTQELYDAIAPGKREVWERLTDDDLIFLDENGRLLRKAELLADFEPLPPGLVGRIAVESLQLALHGEVAVTAHDAAETLDYHGQRVDTRFRSTMTWRRGDGGWRLVQAQVLPILSDPPAVALPATALEAYAGSYRLEPRGQIRTRVRVADGGLVFERDGRPPAAARAEAPDLFFVPGQPRSRKVFRRDASGRISGFADRREGHDVVWVREAP